MQEDLAHVDRKTPDQDHSEGHSHELEEQPIWKLYGPAILSFFMLTVGLIVEHVLRANFFNERFKLIWYVVAYLPVGLPVLKHAWSTARRGHFFTEFFLMSIATIGAFAIREYPEGVAVMLFYSIGELFQSAAVTRSKKNIQALLDLRPATARVLRNGTYLSINPEEVLINEIIQVKAGETIPLDGVLLSNSASINTAALTGESIPQQIFEKDLLLAGSINLAELIDIQVTKSFSNSALARILDLVQSATAKKSKTELLIRRLAKIYTPIVVYMAIAITILPFFFVTDYHFSTWLYRALIFLVISCPCALVISIPLGYFGGLGAASRNGLLFKGATYLDQLTKVNTLVFDKTGTITKGVFRITQIQTNRGWSEEQMMRLLMALESKSTHPIAKAIVAYGDNEPLPEATMVSEMPGKGLLGEVEGHQLMAGNHRLFDHYSIELPLELLKQAESTVIVAIDGAYVGYVNIADELKEDALTTIQKLKSTRIQELVMLSGDKDSITQEVAKSIGITEATGDLLPEQKLAVMEGLKADANRIIAFVGDGINDAPVLAASDIGIAMGGLGSELAIETADIVIQTDQPSKIVTGIRIAESTQRIIWQNIFMAFGVKLIVLILGAVGLASMWAAVFADVGVALLAILNAVRLQGMRWE